MTNLLCDAQLPRISTFIELTKIWTGILLIPKSSGRTFGSIHDLKRLPTNTRIVNGPWPRALPPTASIEPRPTSASYRTLTAIRRVGSANRRCTCRGSRPSSMRCRSADGWRKMSARVGFLGPGWMCVLIRYLCWRRRRRGVGFEI